MFQQTESINLLYTGQVYHIHGSTKQGDLTSHAGSRGFPRKETDPGALWKLINVTRSTGKGHVWHSPGKGSSNL